MVGIRGLVDPSHIHALLDFHDIPGKRRKPAVERTVLTSVKALHFMHQVCFGGLYDRRKVETGRQSNNSDPDVTDDEELQDTLPKQRRRLLQTAAATLTPCPSNHDSGPIPASPPSSGEHAEQERISDKSCTPALNHCPRPDRQEARKRQHRNSAGSQGTTAISILLEQQTSTDQDTLSEPQTMTHAARRNSAS